MISPSGHQARPRWPWAVPIGAIAVIGLAAVLPPLLASASNPPTLPPLSVSAILAKAANSKVSTYTGDLVLTDALGLPAGLTTDISSSDSPSGGQTSLLSALLNGPTTGTIFVNGPHQQRLEVVDPDGQSGEYDIIHNGSTLWIYDSATMTVAEGSLSRGSKNTSANSMSGRAQPVRQLLTPATVARWLSRLSPSTKITSASNALVAGQAAYQVSFSPRSAASLISRVTLSVDASNGFPLRASIYARGARSPAVSLGFTSIDFAPPAADNFNFTPPPGATVKELFSKARSSPAVSSGSGRVAGVSTPARGHLIGSGWDVAVEFPNGLDYLEKSASVAKLYKTLEPSLPTVSTSAGSARLLHTTLLNVLILPSGEILAGPVSPAALAADVG